MLTPEEEKQIRERVEAMRPQIEQAASQPIPCTTINGLKYITVDGIRMLRKALGMPDLLKPSQFPGFRAFQEYMKAARLETLQKCNPAMWDEYVQE